MFKIYTIWICVLNLIIIEANEYCKLEGLFCEGRSHVGCNKISNSDTDTVIELTPYLQQRLVQNLNKFRDDVAHGLIKDVTHIPVSNMNILKWNTNLELLSGNASLKLKHGQENLCFATSDYPAPALSVTTLNDVHGITKDTIDTELIDWMATSFKGNSIFSNPSSYDIGCTIVKDNKSNSYTGVCILYGNENIDNFKYGKPCTKCDSYNCDSIFQGLCLKQKYNDMTMGSAEPQTANEDKADSSFQLETYHIIAVYVLLGGLVILMILMLILIKYLCQYNSHISL